MVIRPTAGGVEVLAPAKLNLFLEVLGKRADGYHELETLMIAIDLHDRLTLDPDDSGQVALTCDDPRLPTGRDNLVVKAAETLRAEAGPGRSESLGVRIHLEKSIPSQAGLGGGSSDAAATLVALDHLWELATPPDRLRAIAGRIGSDVPFFLDAPVAVCRGRGERVEPLELNPDTQAGFHAVLVCPPVGVRTADAFAGLTPPDRPEPIAPALDALKSGDPERLGRRLFNRLQPVAERIQPALGRVRAALNDLGPSALDGHLMSGSGSAYFGLARNREAAEHAASRLGDLGIGMVRVVRCGP